MNDTQIRDRFNEKWLPHPRTGCWQWTSSTNKDGYGQFRLHGRTRKAHRVAWELMNGPIPVHDSAHGMCVLHRRDNRGCVNPAHLFLGTHDDNMCDMANKGRAKKHKLTAEAIIAIREDSRSQRAIAAKHGVCQPLISRIKSDKVWRHVG